jgi:perosamine synthetase
MEFINQMEPWFDGQETRHIVEYLNSGGWITEFKKTREFEKQIAEYTGAKYCSVLANGTITLSVALQACGVKPGDEVIVPDYTMIATPNSAELIGAKAVFADIERSTLCIDVESIKPALSQRTRAVMLVSINGRYPEKMDQIVNLCRENGLFLIEDAAQSLGSFRNGTHLGRFGCLGSFSFSAPKIITTGQGGALITDDEGLFAKIRLLRDFGREQGGSDHYLVKGWNYKFTDLQAIVGIEQMKKLRWRVERKKEIGRLYECHLRDIPNVELITTDFNETAPWFYDILVEDRRGLMEHLRSKGVGTREFYPALHAEPAYGYHQLCFPVTEEIARKGLWLPSSSKLTDDQVLYVCAQVAEYYAL